MHVYILSPIHFGNIFNLYVLSAALGLLHSSQSHRSQIGIKQLEKKQPRPPLFFWGPRRRTSGEIL